MLTTESSQDHQLTRQVEQKMMKCIERFLGAKLERESLHVRRNLCNCAGIQCAHWAESKVCAFMSCSVLSSWSVSRLWLCVFLHSRAHRVREATPRSRLTAFASLTFLQRLATSVPREIPGQILHCLLSISLCWPSFPSIQAQLQSRHFHPCCWDQFCPTTCELLLRFTLDVHSSLQPPLPRMFLFKLGNDPAF